MQVFILIKKGLVSPSRNYPNLSAAMDSIKIVGNRIKNTGIPKDLHPLTFAVTGSTGIFHS